MQQQYRDRGVWSRHITKSRYFGGYMRVYSAKTLVSRQANSHQNQHNFEQPHNAAAIKYSQINM